MTQNSDGTSTIQCGLDSVVVGTPTKFSIGTCGEDSAFSDIDVMDFVSNCPINGQLWMVNSDMAIRINYSGRMQLFNDELDGTPVVNVWSFSQVYDTVDVCNAYNSDTFRFSNTSSVSWSVLKVSALREWDAFKCAKR